MIVGIVMGTVGGVLLLLAIALYIKNKKQVSRKSPKFELV